MFVYDEVASLKSICEIAKLACYVNFAVKQINQFLSKACSEYMILLSLSCLVYYSHSFPTVYGFPWPQLSQ